MCHLACLILALYLNYEGTIVASPTSTEAAESKGSPSFFGSCSSHRNQALDDSNSNHSYAPRVYAPEAHPEDGEPRMELSVSSPGREEQRGAIMVQQLRSSLQYSEMVAADDVGKTIKVSQSSKEREREEAAEGCGREGVDGIQCDAAQHVNASLGLFRAGAAAGHDNLKDLQTIQHIIETNSSVPVEVFSGLNIWDICALISRAEVLVASSLHCRIVAFAYSVPRIAFPVDKVVSFIRLWDSQVADISMSPISQIGSAISQALQGNNAGRFHDKTMARRAVQLYLSSFKLWARMLC